VLGTGWTEVAALDAAYEIAAVSAPAGISAAPIGVARPTSLLNRRTGISGIPGVIMVAG
jgi:hypothetical protein